LRGQGGGNSATRSLDIDALKEFMDSLNVDAQDKGEYTLESITNAISDVMQTYYNIELGEDDLSIATSIGPEKFSAHVIVKNYVVDNNREAAHLTKLLIKDHLLEPLRPCVDAGVNKSTQNFRLLLSHKVGSTRTKVPRGHGYLKEFIISHLQIIVCCHQLPPLVPETEHKNYEGDVVDYSVNQILEMAAPYLVRQRFDKVWSNVLTFKRTASTYCEICKRNQDSNNTVFITVHETVVFLHCCRSEGRIMIRELGRAANEPDVNGFDDEPDAEADAEADTGQPDGGQPPVEGQPAGELPPDRDFTCCLDYKRGVWKLVDVEAFIKQNIVYIMNRGRPHYVTRNLYDGHLSYKTVLPKVMKHTLPTRTIGKNSVSMYKVLERVQRDICYKRVGFKPWLVNPGPLPTQLAARSLTFSLAWPTIMTPLLKSIQTSLIS